jgi:hypothetical protein
VIEWLCVKEFVRVKADVSVTVNVNVGVVVNDFVWEGVDE